MVIKKVDLRNLNCGRRNPKVVVGINHHISTNEPGTIGDTIYIFIESGVFEGGFHTSLDDAKRLRDVLSDEISKVEKT